MPATRRHRAHESASGFPAGAGRGLPAGARELLRVHDPEPELALAARRDEVDLERRRSRAESRAEDADAAADDAPAGVHALEGDRRVPVRPGRLRLPDGLDPPGLPDERPPERQELLAGRVREVRRDRDARLLPDREKVRQADYHYTNTGTYEELLDWVREVMAELEAGAGARA